MTPIEKNILVVDEHGNRYEATYLKRAKGLVKNGRARFVDDHTICLACPPNDETEDKNMSDIKKAATATAETTASPDKFTMNYCLEQIEKIRSQTEYLNQVITELRDMETSGGAAGFADSQKATTLAEVVRCRETTNQRLLAFYEKMYEDLKPRLSAKERALTVLGAAIDRHDVTEDMLESISNMIDTIRHIG